MNAVLAAVRRGVCGFLKPDGTLLTGPQVRASEAGMNKVFGKICYGVKLTRIGYNACIKAGVKPAAHHMPPGVDYGTPSKPVQAAKPATANLPAATV